MPVRQALRCGEPVAPGATTSCPLIPAFDLPHARSTLARTVPVALLASLLATSGCSSDDDSSDAGSGLGPDVGPTVGPTVGDDAAGDLLDVRMVEVPDGVPSAGRARLLRHLMRDVDGDGTTPANSLLLEPAGAPPAGGWPLVAWAHGTTGISDACAPSADFDERGPTGAVERLVGAGFAVLAPDYEGLGGPGVHPYYVRSSHAASVLDAVVAAHGVEGATLSADWAVAGHSQGGHAALAAARAEPLADYPLVAAVASAPGTDLRSVSDLAFDAIDEAVAEGSPTEAAERTFYLNVYGAYVAHGVATVVPSFEPASLFGEDVAPLVDAAADEATCRDYATAVGEVLSGHLLAGGTLADFGGLPRDWYEDPTIAARLEPERLGDESQPMPLRVVQGTADRQIPLAATDAFVAEQRSLGTVLEYVVVEGAGHGDVVLGEMDGTIEFLRRYLPPTE